MINFVFLYCFGYIILDEAVAHNTSKGPSRLGVVQIDEIIMDTSWRYSYLGIPCFSPDGQKIVVRASSELQNDNDTIYKIEYENKIVVVDVNEKKPDVIIESDSTLLYPQFSPKNNEIAFIANDKTWKSLSLRDEKGEIIKLCEGIPIEWFAWSPDGKSIAYISNNDIWILDIDTRTSRKLLEVMPKGHIEGNGTITLYPHLFWSPSEKSILFCKHKSTQVRAHGFDSSDVWLADLNGNARLLIKDGFYPTYSSDGKQIAFTREDSVRDIIVGSDGDTTKLMVSHIYVANADGDIIRKLAEGWSPIWSPDGSHIAFYRAQHKPHYYQQLWLYNIKTKEQILIKSPFLDAAIAGWSLTYYYPPVWSPDGKYIAFQSHRANHADLGIAELISGIKAEITLELDAIYYSGIRIWERGNKIEIVQMSAQLNKFWRILPESRKTGTIPLHEYKKLIAYLDTNKVWNLSDIDKPGISDGWEHIFSIGMYKNSKWQEHHFHVYVADRYNPKSQQEKIILMIEELAKKYVK